MQEITPEGLWSPIIPPAADVDNGLAASLLRLPQIKNVGKKACHIAFFLLEADADLATSHLYSCGEL